MLKQSGTFKYIKNNEDHKIKLTVTDNYLNMIVYTFDNVYKVGEYNFKREDLITFVNAIKKSWIEENNVSINIKSKEIDIINRYSNYERVMDIKINNKCIIYGFDIKLSRKWHQALAQIINNKKTDHLK